MKIFLVIGIAGITIIGCSNKSLYQTGQSIQQSKCVAQAVTSEQHNKCLTDKPETFEEYQRKRESVIAK